MKEVWGGPLEKVDDFRWRIPKSYKPGMRVPGLIYADEELLKDIRSDRAPEQVANVAHMPGIINYSFGMPDIHWGYGAAIGGVGAFDVEKGVIAPGFVGYDINCLCNSLILNELGYRRQIKDFEEDFHKRKLVCMNFNKDREETTEIIGFLKQKPKRTVLNVVTETGRQIDATEDHPFYTKDGMKELGRLSTGDEIAIYPFEGVEYEEPSSEIIIDKDDIKSLLLKLGKTSRGSALEQILIHLEKKNILPLRYNSPQLPYLLKIMGYCFGDGVIYFGGKRNRGTSCFYGHKEDLKKIKEDLFKIGFKSSIYSRHRHHRINTMYSVVEFDSGEVWLKTASSGLAALLAVLGTPIGNKCHKPYELPKWLFKAPLWQKRLFLAAFSGAEMSSPKTLTGHGYNFYCPTISMNKTEDCLESGRRFLEGISKLLSEFGVSTHQISQRKEYVNKQGIVSYRLRLMGSDKTENLINLYSRVGFEYNEERKFLANAATGYLRLKDSIIKEKKEVAALAPKLFCSTTWGKEELYGYLNSPNINEKFIERSLYEPRKTDPRMWGDDPTFDEFIKRATEGLGRSGMIWERVRSISDLDFDDWVYDFTVAHLHHNFIANNFVVSNCGVRLVRTNLRKEDMPPEKLKGLVYALFSDIPAGVGSRGEIRFDEREERELLLKGSEYVVGRGFGTKEDLECTEEGGAIKGADPSKVSARAYERGKRQSGTLGSGNHFIEVQVVDQVYDNEIAKVFGLEEGGITVMIHSGSRGLGYQVCDEYAKGMIGVLDKYGIRVPDRQLACAPVNSPEGQAYLGAMRCAANYAWANRQCLMHLARKTFERVFGRSWQDMDMKLIYDVAHNIAKIEKHVVDGKERTLCIHRKGATRAFPPGHPDIPERYRQIGQPVIIPGDMGRYSFLLVGTEKAAESFYSTCHGSGRVMSRHAAIRALKGRSIARELEERGIIVKGSGREILAEEASEAYKDVRAVVHVVHEAGISKRVCRMKPLGVMKG